VIYYFSIDFFVPRERPLATRVVCTFALVAKVRFPPTSMRWPARLVTRLGAALGWLEPITGSQERWHGGQPALRRRKAAVSP
jgi:hypothetical protein